MLSIIPKIDSSGTLHKILLEETTVLNIFTKSGKYRGGKTYSEDKYFTLIYGKVVVTTYDGEKDVKKEYFPGEIHKISAGIPNLFYFSKDSEMLEWFPNNAIAQTFERYKEIKKQYS